MAAALLASCRMRLRVNPTFSVFFISKTRQASHTELLEILLALASQADVLKVRWRPQPA